MPCQSLGTSISSLTFCHWSGSMSVQEQIAQSSCKPPPPTPRPLAGPSLGLETVMFLLGMKMASQEATPATPSRCQVPQWDTWQEHHMAYIALALLWVSASLLLGFE